MFKRESKQIFLGGTCNGSHWRDYFIPRCKLTYFNPVVDVWTDEAHNEEEWHMANDRYLLWVLTPKQEGYLTIAEAVDLAYRYGKRLIFTMWDNEPNVEFTEFQRKSIREVYRIIERAGGTVFYELDDVIDYLK